MSSFAKEESLSRTKLSLNIFIDSPSLLIITKISKKTKKIDNRYIRSKLFFINTPIISKEKIESDKIISGIKY